MFKKILLATMVAASFGTAPLVTSAAQRAIVITEAPPPPRHEVIPPVRRGHEWAPGHWGWRHGRHVWVAGHWIPERRGHHWVADRWVERDGRWVLVNGHWERGGRDRAHAIREETRRLGHRGMNDRDGDGVPNRYDARPNNPRRY